MALTGFILLLACNSENKPPINETTFKNILSDIHLYEAKMNKYKQGTDSLYFALGATYEYIYKKHGVTQQQFLETFHFYEANPKKFEKLYEGVVEKLSEEEAKMKN